ncbi:MAG TPA: hypothetical protein DIW52_15315, partial [Pseudomonas sp.]|nr:hypothetical protein [Pseudomonas sp.]
MGKSVRWSAGLRSVERLQSNVGTGLLANAVGQSTSMLDVLASSRAGSLPHSIFAGRSICVRTDYLWER